jgi:hypothetical protein
MLTQLFLKGRVPLVPPFIGAAALWGQAVGGTISGTVTDPSSVAIAGARGAVVTAGCYSMPQLPSVHIGSDRASRRDVFGVA